MSIEKPANERLELYNKFKQSLSRKVDDEQFFDADDLIIIHDQAVDLDDQYVQIEALMRGFRYFPDNEEFASRRAFLYYDLNLDQGAKDVANRYGDETPIWELLKMRLNESLPGAADELRPMLDNMLATTSKFDDETIIQLVDAASACGHYDWLKANEKTLRKKTEYLPALLYEIFAVSEINGDLPYGISLLEELTEIDPFNFEFWSALTQAHMRNNDAAAALNACDYALAIQADDPALFGIKANALGILGRFDEVIELTEPYVKANRLSELTEPYIRARFSKGDISSEELPRMFRLLHDLCLAFPENRGILQLAIELETADCRELVSTIYTKDLESHPDDYFEWAQAYYTNGHPRQAAFILKAMYDAGDLADYHRRDMYYTALYTGREYLDCIELFEQAMNDDVHDISPTLAVAGLLSYLHIGDKEKCAARLKQLQSLFPLPMKEVWVLGSNLQTLGFGSYLEFLETFLKKRKGQDVSEVDIFRLPETYRDPET